MTALFKNFSTNSDKHLRKRRINNFYCELLFMGLLKGVVLNALIWFDGLCSPKFLKLLNFHVTKNINLIYEKCALRHLNQKFPNIFTQFLHKWI